MEISPTSVKKKVMVIGAGLAGMEAARVAALRGHIVSLYEKDDQLGGQLQIAAKAPGREDMAEPVRYYQRQFELLGVDVHLGTEVDVATLEAEAPDAVVVATGGLPSRPSFPGADQPNVVLARDVLAGKASVGKQVLLYSMDRSMEGFTTAEFLLDRDCGVELLIPHPFAEFSAEQITYVFALNRIHRKGGKMTLALQIGSVEGSRVVLSGVFGGPPEVREGVDTVVVSRGSRANDDLYKALKGRVNELHAVGQCLAPRRMVESTLDGLRVARMV